MEEVYQYTLNLPKQSRDPYGLQLISTTNVDKIRGIEEGLLCCSTIRL